MKSGQRILPATPGQRPWQREPLVWMLIAIPSSAVLMGVLMISLALYSNDGLVVDDYYRQGKEINRVLRRDRAAAAYGLKATIQLDVVHGSLRAQLESLAHRQPLPQALTLQLLHATRAGLDQRLRLDRTPDSEYYSLLPTLAPGHWYAQLETEDWRLTGHIQLPQDSEIVLLPNLPNHATALERQ